MDMIKACIEKDGNTIKYIKLIRGYAPSLSMGEIKAHIGSGEPVITFDMDAKDWIYMEGMTQEKWQMAFFDLLDSLQKSGAVLHITAENDITGCKTVTMKELRTMIRRNKEIMDDVEKYPD